MQYSKITYPFHDVLSKCHILFRHEWRVHSNKQMVRFAKTNPYQKFWKFVIHDIKPRANQSSQKLIYLRYFETLSTFFSTQNYLILETIHNEKKTVKKTMPKINHFRIIIFKYMLPRSRKLWINRSYLFSYDFQRKFWLNLSLLTKVSTVI